MFSAFVGRSFAEMETQRDKSATPTRDYVAASSSVVVAVAAAAAATDGEKTKSSNR